MRRRSISRRCFDGFNVFFMWIIIVLMLFPYLNVLAKALNDGADTARGGILFWPRIFTWDNFGAVIFAEGFSQALFISVARVVGSVILTIIIQFMCAYVFTYKDLVGRGYILLYLMIPGYFGGGLIPTYILYSKIGLLNNFLCYVIPGMFSMYNMIIIRTYMNSLPLGLKEAAKIDGASEIKVLFRIIMPLCKPIMATIALWVAVGDWNDWTTTMYFFTRKYDHLFPLSYLLQQVLKETERIQQMIQDALRRGDDISQFTEMELTTEAVRCAQIIVTTIPIIATYPFLQKYFIHGVTVGAVKE